MSEVENQPSVLIVTGMHRSGTSLTAAFLQAIGVDLGDKLLQGNYGNPKGYFEDVDFVESSRGSKRVCLFAPDVTEQKKIAEMWGAEERTKWPSKLPQKYPKK